MSDINDDLKDLFKTIDENRPEHDLPLSREIYDSYIKTTPRPINHMFKTIFIATPVLIIGALSIIFGISLTIPKNKSAYVNNFSGPTNQTAGIDDKNISNQTHNTEGETRNDYIEVFDNVLNTFNDNNQQNNMDNYNIVSNFSDYNIIKTYLYYVDELFHDESYPITNSGIITNCDYKNDNEVIQDNWMCIKTNILNDNINCQIYGKKIVTNSFDNKDDSFYLQISIESNNNVIKSYDLYYGEIRNNQLVTKHINKYQNNTLYERDYNKNKDELNQVIGDYLNLYNSFYKEINDNQVVSLKKDYSDAYKNAIDFIMGNDYYN